MLHDNKKITFLITSLSGGGSEGLSVNLANSLAKRGWEVNLIVLHMKNSVYHERLNKNVNFVILDTKHAVYSPYKLIKYLLTNKPKKILVFTYELTVITILIKKLLNLNITIIARNRNTMSHVQKRPGGLWVKLIVNPLVKIFYSYADHIINQCEGMRNDLLTIYPEISQKTSVIYNPINSIIEEYAKTQDLANKSSQEYILCVGRLDRQKAFHFAIEGFAKITQDFPKLRLKIVGKGILENELKRCAAEHDVQSKVDFEGFKKNMIPYYLDAEITLLTSLYEGFPNVLVESIALGTPIVAFDCQSGPKEIVLDSINGHLAIYKNVDNLAEKLKIAINTKWDTAVVAESAKRFSMLNTIKAYEDTIERL